MKNSIVRIPVSNQKFWSKYLEILNPVLRLQNKEREVLACIILIATTNRSKPNLEEKLLDYDSRVKIRSYLKMSEASLNNIISELKKKKLILRTDKGFKVLKQFMDIETNVEHTITFVLSGNDTSTIRGKH